MSTGPSQEPRWHQEDTILASGSQVPCSQLRQILQEPQPIWAFNNRPSQGSCGSSEPRPEPKAPTACSPLARSTFAGVTGSWLVGYSYQGRAPLLSWRAGAGMVAKPGRPPSGGSSSGGLKTAHLLRHSTLVFPSHAPTAGRRCLGGTLSLPGQPSRPCCALQAKGAELPGEQVLATRTVGHLLYLDRRKMPWSPTRWNAPFWGVSASVLRE